MIRLLAPLPHPVQVPAFLVEMGRTTLTHLELDSNPLARDSGEIDDLCRLVGTVVKL